MGAAARLLSFALRRPTSKLHGSAQVAVRTRHSSSSSMLGSTRRRPSSRSTRPAGISAGPSTPSLGEPWSSVGHCSVFPLTLLTGWRPWTSVAQRPSAPPGHSRSGRGRPPKALARPPPSTGPVPSTESGVPPRRCLPSSQLGQLLRYRPPGPLPGPTVPHLTGVGGHLLRPRTGRDPLCRRGHGLC